MENQKRNLVISTMFQQAGHATGIALGWGLGIALITYLLGLIISHNLESFLVSLRALPSIASSILSVLLMAIFLVTPYTDFKWAIQNGISRKTLWRGVFKSIIISNVTGWVILVIYLIIVYALARFFNNKIQLRRD